MTDERREEIRRLDDQVADRLNDHITDFKELKDAMLDGTMLTPSGKSVNDLIAEHDGMVEGQDRIYNVLMGPEVRQMDGTVKRAKHQGLVAKVEMIDSRLTNGGVKVRLSPGLWALLVAITTGMFGLSITIIQSM